jgi:hypothetical protein
MGHKNKLAQVSGSTAVSSGSKNTLRVYVEKRVHYRAEKEQRYHLDTNESEAAQRCLLRVAVVAQPKIDEYRREEDNHHGRQQICFFHIHWGWSMPQRKWFDFAVAGVLTIVSLASLAACSSLLQDPPGVSFGKAVEDLGILPVFPPREDIQVGDIYGVEDNPKVEGVRRHSVLIDHVDLTEQIRRELQQQYQFANTTVSSAAGIDGLSATVPPSQVDGPSGKKVLTRSNLTALPITGLPAIEVDTGLSVGLAGAPQGLAAVFSFAAARTEKMTLNFGMVTSYSVPIPEAVTALKGYCNDVRTIDNCQSANLTYYLNQKYQFGTDTRNAILLAHPLMVSKVYLAREISYTFNDKTLAAAAAAGGAQQGKSTPTAPVVDPKLLSSAVNSGNPDMVSALAAFQTALASNEAANQNTQGVAVQIASYNQNSVTFSEIFQRPVVVAYEGAALPTRR